MTDGTQRKFSYVTYRTLVDALSLISYSNVDRYSDVGPYHLDRMAPSDTMVAEADHWIYVDFPQDWTIENWPDGSSYHTRAMEWQVS
ncbi:MAG: hypothetical protein ACE5QF_04065 [Thermoplasmata archaeon]